MTSFKYHGIGLAVCAASALLLFITPLVTQNRYPSVIPVFFFVVMVGGIFTKVKSYNRYKLLITGSFEMKLVVPLIGLPAIFSLLGFTQLVVTGNINGSEWILFVVAWLLGSHIAYFAVIKRV